MNEKRFYHMVLEGRLLNGKALKHRIDRVLFSATSANTSRSSERKTTRSIKWITVPVTAMLILATLVIALIPGAKLHKHNPAASIGTANTAPTSAPATLNLVNEKTDIHLVSEFDAELRQECMDWRDSHGKSFNASDWNWLLNTEVKTVTAAERAGKLSWSVIIRPDSIVPFTNTDWSGQEQATEISLWRAWYTTDNGEKHSLSDVIDTTGSRIDTTEGMEYLTFCQRDVDEALPTAGRITVTAQYCVVDCSVEDMGRYFGSVALIEHTFSFNAEGINYEIRHFPVALSGNHMLTVQQSEQTYTNIERSLEGVILDTNVWYTPTGIDLCFSVAYAPTDWTDAERNALLLSMQNCTASVGMDNALPRYRIGDGESKQVQHIQSGYPWRYSDSHYIIPLAVTDPAWDSDLTVEVFTSHLTSLSGEEKWTLYPGKDEPVVDSAVTSLFSVKIPKLK